MGLAMRRSIPVLTLLIFVFARTVHAQGGLPPALQPQSPFSIACLLYTSDAADEL